MGRSRLEVYVDVLKGLACGSSKLTHIMYETGVNYTVVKQRLEFLLKQNLVEETIVKKRNIYHITERGIAALEALSTLENTLQVSCSSSGVAEQTIYQCL